MSLSDVINKNQKNYFLHDFTAPAQKIYFENINIDNNILKNDYLFTQIELTFFGDEVYFINNIFYEEFPQPIPLNSFYNSIDNVTLDKSIFYMGLNTPYIKKNLGYESLIGYEVLYNGQFYIEKWNYLIDIKNLISGINKNIGMFFNINFPTFTPAGDYSISVKITGY